MLSRIDSREFSEWQAYYSIDPFGDQRADLRNAILCSTVLAPHVEKGKTGPKPSEFMLFQDKESEPEKSSTQKTVTLSGKAGALVARQLFSTPKHKV